MTGRRDWKRRTLPQVVNGIIGDFAALKDKEFGAAAEDGSATFTVENCGQPPPLTPSFHLRLAQLCC